MGDAQLETLMQRLGANVRRHRVRRGLTQEELAEAADVDASYVQRVERGQANVTLAVLATFASALNIDGALLLRKAPMKARPTGRPPLSSGRRR